MAYNKIIYQNSPSTDTPINAENLNHMDDQIALNDQRLTDLEGAHVSSFNGRTGAVTPADGDYDIGQIAPLTGAQVGQVPVVTNIGTAEDPELVFRMGAGGGAGGHEIIASDGTQMPQESAMQFADAFLTDDSQNGRTVVENIKEHTTKADYDAATEDGFHVIDDGNDVPVGASSEDYEEVEAGAHTTVGALLDELYSKIDFTKISKSSIFERIDTNGAKLIFAIQQITSSNVVVATLTVVSSARTNGITWHVKSSGSKSYEAVIGSTPTDDSGTELTEHTKFRLYYGTSSSQTILKTDANYCQYDENNTVKQYISKNNLGATVNILSYTSTSNPYVFPSDGYVIFGARDSGSNAYGKLYGADMNYATELRARSYSNNEWDMETVFVKKGMKFVYDSGSGYTLARFNPLG